VSIKAIVLDADDNGKVLHIEIEQPNGETVIGMYELVGWTKAPKDVKAKTERELWVPPKAT
jgi:uncharacterized protein YuzE